MRILVTGASGFIGGHLCPALSAAGYDLRGSVDGWGEGAPFAAPCYSPEWAGGAFAVARDWLAPAILGRDIRSGAELQQHLAIYKGNPFAKAVLDTAWWSLSCKLSGVPLHKSLGATRGEAPVGADFGVMDRIVKGKIGIQ